MSSETPTRRWGVEQRLEFIEFKLFWEGRLKRGDLTEFFGVSVPQASTDISTYKVAAEMNLNYDAKEKRYIVAQNFRPEFYKPNADRYLAQLKGLAETIISPEETWIANPPEVDTLPIPHRRIGAELLRRIIGVIRSGTSIEILHQSLSSRNSELAWHRITPHALGSDGLRWHIRGFCHEESRFKDFIISRCRDVRNEGPAGANPNDDLEWHTLFNVALMPNPKLTQSQQDTVAKDFDMENGKVIVPVRLAMLYYFEKRLRLDVDVPDDRPKEKPVIIANLAEFEKARPRRW